MNRLLLYLGRFALILAGYAIASVAASAFMNVLLYGSLDLTPDEAAGVVTGSIIFTIPFVALFVAYFAFFPAIVAIIVGEVLGRRDWLYYALAGGVVSLAMILMIFGAGRDDTDLMSYGWLAATLVGAGIVGGVAYWLVAGRMAGSWYPGADGRLPPPA